MWDCWIWNVNFFVRTKYKRWQVWGQAHIEGNIMHVQHLIVTSCSMKTNGDCWSHPCSVWYLLSLVHKMFHSSTRPSNSFLLPFSKIFTVARITCVHTFLILLSLFLSCYQIMVLTDPEFESSVLISSDEGASYQKYRLTFYVLSLLFHPTEEDWALAYSHDQKVRLPFMLFYIYLVSIIIAWALCYTQHTFTFSIPLVNSLMIKHSFIRNMSLFESHQFQTINSGDGFSLSRSTHYLDVI